MSQFPALKVRALLALLTSESLGYRVVRQTGSHRRLEAPGRPPLTIAFHSQEVPGFLVRRILVREVGLSVADALELIARG
jgi:predicted RNA binding protein YcfA (HicA-like mRNA interferase family)